MVGVGDLASKRDGGADGEGASFVEDAAALDGMVLLRAQFGVEVFEGLAPLGLWIPLKEIAAVIGHGSLDVVGGQGLEVADENFFRVLFGFLQTATGEGRRQQKCADEIAKASFHNIPSCAG